MKNKFLIPLFCLMLLLLAACGSSGESKIESKKNTEQDFIECVSSYMTVQQKLMRKQAEGVSGSSFEELSNHSKKLVESEEYSAWKDAGKELADFDTSGMAEAEKFEKLKKTIADYDQVQTDYFQGAANAADLEAYNAVGEEFSEKLNQVQDDLISAYEKLSE